MSIYFLRYPDNIHSKIKNLGGGGWGTEKRQFYSSNITDITKKFSIDGCSIFRGPSVDFESDSLKLAKEYKVDPVPDIVEMHSAENALLVSDECKRIIEKYDDFGHQFAPMNFYDSKDKLRQDRKFYWCNIRRYVCFQENNLEPHKIIPEALKSHRVAIGNIQNIFSLRSFLEIFPIWRVAQIRPTGDGGSVFLAGTNGLFLNEAMFEAFKNANLRGIKEVTGSFSKSTEHIYHV